MPNPNLTDRKKKQWADFQAKGRASRKKKNPMRDDDNGYSKGYGKEPQGGGSGGNLSDEIPVNSMPTFEIKGTGLSRLDGLKNFKSHPVRMVISQIAQTLAGGNPKPQGFHFAQATNILKHTFGDAVQKQQVLASVHKHIDTIKQRCLGISSEHVQVGGRKG